MAVRKLATATPEGRPSSRMVLLKQVDDEGFVFFTNYHSAKAQQLESNPYAALVFYWPQLDRQVRIEGKVERTSVAESAEYFRTRPRESQIGAWASPQSHVIEGRSTIVARAAEYGIKLGLNPPRPPHWGGYRLKPDYWEFWQGRASRLHVRIVYRLQADGTWLKQRLAP